VTPDEHRRIKILSATHGVTISQVARYALLNDRAWEHVAEMKTKLEVEEHE